MPPKKISDPAFRGGDALSHEQWRSLETTNSADSPRLLLKNWGGSVVGFLSLYLSNDCQEIDQLLFSLTGNIFEDTDGLRANASKFWDVDDHITFELPVFDARIFSFRNGTMVSDYLDHS